MKISRCTYGLLLAGLLYLLPSEAFSQQKGGGPPPWAPAHGYRAKTRHVYFPDHNFYFDTQNGVYIFIENSNWRVAAKLPSLFGTIDLKASTQIELDLHSDSPQNFNTEHRHTYKRKAKEKGKGHGHGKGKGKPKRG